MRAQLNLFTQAQPELLKRMIKSEILKYVRLNLTEGKVGKMDEYLSKTMHISPWTTKKVILFAIDYLKFQLSENEQVISIDEEQMLPATSYRVIDIIKLINYGNLEVRGTQILTEAFRYMEQNLNKILMRKVVYYGS